ncbi:MAG TPA: BON domain-containing protein [Pyrinomonadaceae bacterium]|nr:BON domain-containing protein [Pyrinomonadaceae bacterium]
MDKSRFLASVACVALAVVLAGCDTATNTNTNANGNTAVINANANVNANANANANRNANAGRANANITREEYERDKESFAEEAKRLGRRVGTGANDGWLWVKTRAALATTDDLRESTIDVDVDNAAVTLSGSVASAAQRTKAEQVARGIEGVKSVKNDLRVSADGGNANQNANRGGGTN